MNEKNCKGEFKKCVGLLVWCRNDLPPVRPVLPEAGDKLLKFGLLVLLQRKGVHIPENLHDPRNRGADLGKKVQFLPNSNEILPTDALHPRVEICFLRFPECYIFQSPHSIEDVCVWKDDWEDPAL